jgi:prophage regulatory protein
MKPDRFLRLQDVLYRIGISRSSVYKLMETGQFPAQIKIGYSSVWSERAIVAWMEAQVAASLVSFASESTATTSTATAAVMPAVSPASLHVVQGGGDVK